MDKTIISLLAAATLLGAGVPAGGAVQFAAASGASVEAAGGRENAAEAPGLRWNIAAHLAASYSGWNSFAHLGGVGATWFLIETQIDARVQEWSARRHKVLSGAASFPALAGGFFAPALVPFYMMRSTNPRIRKGGLAAGQAVAAALCASTLLKALSGRSAPDARRPHDVERRSRRFRFGFLRGGVFDGWPSGHAMTNMALAASLSSYFGASGRLRLCVYGWAAYVMAGVTFGARGGVHWLSDAVAGGLMGWAIGTTIGKRFATYSAVVGDGRAALRPAVRPLIAPDRRGFQLVFPL